MPFTFSHPAAAVPLAGRRLVLSALVIGSMAPDFAYFLPVPFSRGFGHTVPGLVLFSVPIGLAVLWLFQRILKQPLLSLLPPSHRQRLLPAAGGFSFGPQPHFAWILLSLLAGALTHVAWDAFTHGNGWIVEQVPFLRQTVMMLPYGPLRLYRLLQHASTLLGAGLLFIWYVRWYQRAVPVEGELTDGAGMAGRFGLLLSFALAALILGLILGLTSLAPLTSANALRRLVGRTVVIAIPVLFAELFVFSLWWMSHKKPQPS